MILGVEALRNWDRDLIGDLIILLDSLSGRLRHVHVKHSRVSFFFEIKVENDRREPPVADSR